MSRYNDLLQQIEDLKRQAEEVRRHETQSIIAEIRATMEKYGLTVEDLQGGSRRTKKAAGTSTVAPKYRNPATGETWTGRGRAPRWLAEAEAGGQSRESFLIG